MLDGDFSHVQLYPQHLEHKWTIVLFQREHEQFDTTSSKNKILKKYIFLILCNYATSKLEFNSKSEQTIAFEAGEITSMVLSNLSPEVKNYD